MQTAIPRWSAKQVTGKDMLRIRLEDEICSTLNRQIADQGGEDSLAQHQNIVQASLEQVYNQVDQRISKVEDFLKKQGGLVRSEQ